MIYRYLFEEIVEKRVTVPLDQNQFDALVCFVFNIGEIDFINSDLIILLNSGNYESVPNELNRWVYGNDGNGNLIELPGLIIRRENEGLLFSEGIYVSQ